MPNFRVPTVDIRGRWYLAATTLGFLANGHFLSSGSVLVEDHDDRRLDALVDYSTRSRSRSVRLRIPRASLEARTASFRPSPRRSSGDLLLTPWRGWAVAMSSDGRLFSARRSNSLLMGAGAMVLARPEVPFGSLLHLIAEERSSLGLTWTDVSTMSPMRSPLAR